MFHLQSSKTVCVGGGWQGHLMAASINYKPVSKVPPPFTDRAMSDSGSSVGLKYHDLAKTRNPLDRWYRDLDWHTSNVATSTDIMKQHTNLAYSAYILYHYCIMHIPILERQEIPGIKRGPRNCIEAYSGKMILRVLEFPITIAYLVIILAFTMK